MNEEPVVRTFVSIAPPPEIRQAIRQLPIRRSASDSIRWTPADQLHLTLRFIGNVPVKCVEELAERLCDACRYEAAFDLEARGVGCFPDIRRPRVVWLGLRRDVDALAQLRQRILEATRPWGKADDKPFHPHLTLARIRPPTPRAIRRLLSESPAESLGTWTVGEVHLMRSDLTFQGAHHALLRSVPLPESP